MAHNITVVYDLTPDDVTCGTHTNGRRGHVDLGPDVTLHGTIAELRAVAVEIDRQLARLEVEHRIDQAVAKCGTCGCRVIDGECEWCDHIGQTTSDEGTDQ